MSIPSTAFWNEVRAMFARELEPAAKRMSAEFQELMLKHDVNMDTVHEWFTDEASSLQICVFQDVLREALLSLPEEGD